MNEFRNYTGVSKIRAFDDKEQLIIVWFKEYEKKSILFATVNIRNLGENQTKQKY